MKVNRKFLRSAERLSLSAIAKDSAAQKIVSAVTAIGFVMQPVAALASTITRADKPDVNLATSPVTKIFAENVFGNVAINKFDKFQLDANHIANMYFGMSETSNSAANLVNFVDSRIDINGTVNAIQNQKIGGNLFFFSSDGMAVGKTGVINAGALYVATPTSTKFDEYKKFADQDNFDTIIKDEGFAKIPINASGTISVLGKVNAVNAVNMRAAKIGVGKNVSGEAFDNVDAGATATGASISTGVVDFSNLVNIKGKVNVNAGLTGDLKATKAKDASGDIVLAAYNNYNDNYSVTDDFSKIAGESVNAELTVAKDAVVKAAGNAKLSAQALNNVVVEESDQYKENYTPSTATNSHLYGQIVTTNATVNVDGTVEAKQVDITADAKNRYISAESSVLNASNVTSNIVGALTANLDASYAVLNSKAEVNVGQDAVINATGSDTVGSEGKVVKPALNIQANSSVEAGAGASTALLKVMNVAGTNIIPAAAVTYSKTNNEAAVNIDGTLKSKGGASVTALADSKVNSEAKATTMDVSENPNLGDVALNITTGDNTSSVTIGKTAKMTELQKDVNIEAKSVNSVITKAEVSTGEKAVVATAINVTDYDSKADVNINGNVSSKEGSLAINAENVLTDNTVIANNAMGSSAFMKKIVTNIKGPQTLDTLIGEGGAKDKALGGIKNWLANAKYTPQKLKDKLNAPSTPSTPTQPKPWDKLADFMSTGVSVGVAVESNTADVKIGQGVALTAKNDLDITAKSVIQDTQMQITGKSNNYDKDTSNKALVNASVLYGKLDNTATVTVAGGEEAKGSAPATDVTLTGGKVNIAANSSFEYNRINRMVQEVMDACAKVKDAYKGTNNDEINAKADALSTAADEFFTYAKNNCFSSNGEEQVDFMDLFGGETFQKFTKACNDLTSALGDKAAGIAVGPLNVVSAAAAFANPNSYLNFSAGSANGGKSGSNAATIALAGSAVATDISNNARVLIGKNANITAKEELAMKAASKQFDVSLAGKLGLNGGGESAVGGTFAVGLADANSLVAVAQGAKLTAGSIAIGTENKIDHVQLSLAAGKGASKGVSGMVGYLEGASNSLVSVDDEAVINAGTGAVNLNAKNDTNVYSAAGAVAMGETAGIGVAATITNFDRYTYAAIGDNGYAAPPQATTKQGESGSDSGDKLGEDANADRSKEAEKLANTAAEKRATLQQLVQNASGLRQGTDDGKTYTEQADFFGSKTAANTKGSIDAGSFKVNAETGGKIINVAVAGGVSTADDSGEVGIFDKLGNFVSNKTNALTNKLHALDHKVAGKINGLMDRQTEAQKVLPTDQTPKATPSGQQSSVTIAGAGSAAINLLDGDTGALVDNVKINIAKNTAEDKTITVTAKDTTMMVAAGGAAGISWKNLTKDNNANSNNAAFGGTAAVNDIDSQTLAVISNSEIENAAAIINNAQKSGSLAAAGLGLALAKNSGGNGGTNIAATVNASVNIADNTAYALLQNNKVNTDTVSGEDKRATSITNTAFDNDIQITGGVNTSLSIGGDNAFVGGATVSYGSLKNDVQAAILGGTYDKITTADVKATTNMTQVGVAANVSVAGGAKTSYAFSGNSAYNSLNNTTGAYVKGSEISGANDDASSILTVDAANKGNVYSVGAAVTAGTANALNGVVVVNRGRNDVEAVIDKYDGENAKTDGGRTKLNNMSKVAVKSSDDSNQLAVVGAVSVSAGSNAKFAAGGSVAYNEIGNITGSAGEKKQTNKAAINNADITTTEDGKISVNAIDESTLTTISVGTSITTGNVAFSGAGSAAMIKKDTDTELVNTNINKDKNNAATVQATADSKGKITTVAVVAAGAKDAAIGAGIAVNQLDADTNTTVTNGEYKVKGFTAEAKSDSSILSVGVAGGVAKTAGIAGNIGVNLLANDTKAAIDGAKINADGTLAVIAKSKDTLQNFAGAFGVAAGGQAGVGMGVAYNEISGTTESIVNNAELTAAGNDAGVAVNERNKDNDNVVSDKTRKGVIIAADAEHKLTNVAISGGVAVSADVGVGVAGTVTVNRILGATNAKVTDSSINAALTDRSKADVYVAANDATKSESHVGSLGVGGGADGGAGVGLASDTGVVSRNVTAMIDGGSAKKLVNGNSIDVAALNKAKMSTNSYGVAAAGGAYGAGAGAGTVSVAKLDAETTAAVKNIQGTNNGLAITADHVNDITLRSAAAAASGALVSAAGGAGIGVVDDDSKTVAELNGSKVTAETGDITVNAANKTDVTTAVFGVAASMVAGGLNVAVNNLDNTVSTLVKDNSNLQAQGTFAAKADNRVKTSFVNGADAVGAAGVAVGVGVNTIDTGVITEISGSKITAGAIDVAATEKLDVKQVVENAALGGHGYSANVSVTTIGAAAADQYGDTETTDSDKKATFNANDILNKANAAIEGQGTVGTVTNKDGKSSSNAAGMTFDKYTDSNGQKLSAGPGTTASKGSSKAAGVQAKVSNSTLQATGDTKVNAKRTVDAKLTSAQVAAGIAGNGIAASVAVLDVERKTGVTINNNSKLSGKNVTLGSAQDGTSKIDAYQVAAGAAFAGSAAYAQNSLHGANAITINNSTLQATGDNSSKGTLTVKAEDTSSAAVRTIGATAGAMAGGVLVTNATNNSDNTVTIGGSKLIAGKDVYEKIYVPSTNDKPDYYKTNYDNVIGYNNIGTVDVASVKANSITAETYGGMVGVAAAQGIVALATDAGSSKVNVTGASGFLGNSVSLNATNKPAVRAEAQAYSGGLLAVAGVAVSKAKASGTVEAKVADGSSFAADNVEITANVTTQTAKDKNDNEYVVDNVSAKTIGATASGQYAAGFNTAYAENDMTVSVDVGKEQYNVNALKLKADNASVISADTLGVTVGGYIASGSNWSDTKTNLTTSVKAAGVKENVYNRLGAVNISSSGYSAVNNDANGYGGGIVGFNPVAARSQNEIKTNTTADVSGKWQGVGSLSVAANNADKLDILADSLTAAVVGASGTEIKNKVAHNANINVTGDITTSGKQFYIANNTLNHDVDLKGSGYGGGSVNVNDMDNVLKYTAGVNIDNANLNGIGSAGSIEALAYTDGKMNYSNTLKSAGVVPVTIAASKNVITYNNSIKVTGSKLSTAKADQDITLAATDETTATFDTTADTQGGAVGAASAKTDNTLNRSNKITVTDGKILSTNDVNIYAGANLDGITSSLTYNVLADAYNKTAVPLATAPKAKNTMTQENQVSINGDIDSLRHVNFKAGKGMTTVSTSAREYNIYKGTSGIGSVTSTALGEVTPGETVANYVDIASGKNVRAGIHNNLELTISGSTKVIQPQYKDGKVVKEGSIDFSGIKVKTDQDWFDTNQNVTADVVELQNGLYARLQEINDLLGQYASTSDEYSILNSERNRIITQMEENGFVKTSVENGKTYKSIFDKISLPAVDVKDIVVSGGNINIEADKLQGSGSLTAQGAKNLTINNSSDLYLKINDLAIKDKGGVIRYNDAEVSKVDGFNGAMNTAAGTNADPKITVTSTGTSTNGLTKADIGVFGTVQNSTGDVLIQNSNYNINVDGNANISARNIELKADKGSVTQNSKGLLLIGGDPVTKYQFSDAIAKKIQSYVSQQAIAGNTTIDWLSNIGSYDDYKKALLDNKDALGLTPAEVKEIENYSVDKSSGIVAGNNVYISGLNVNLDGLVQSGYKEFKVTLDNEANNKIGKLDSDYARNRTALTDQYVMSNDKYCVSTNAGAVYNAATGAYDYTVKVYYNPATKELLTEAIEPNGGKIYITGALSSTGSGKLLAMDGTANIAINTTNADRDLRVNKITNKDITGLISIKDTQKKTLTEYTTDGQKMSVKTTTLDNRGNAFSTSTTPVDGSATTYKPADGMTINWTGGTSGDKKIIKWQYEKDFVFWGLIKYGTTKDFVENEEVKNGKTEVSSSSITGTDPLGQGTVIKVNNNAKEYGVTTKDYNNPDESTYTPVVENKKYSGVSGKIFGYGNCTYTWTETQMHSTSSTYTIKGDKPINVGFMTGGSGDISVTSAKDMYLAGNISNATKDDGSAIGKVTLNSNGGAISSVGSARVDADDLTAKAAKGISINHSALGNMAKLNIEATTGDVSINSDRGKLQFVGGNKGALSGNLVINAAGDITTASDTVLNGNRIDFTTLGAINAAIAPGQTLTSSDTMSASVNANAYGDITLTNSNGDMRIGHIASQNGDVSLTTSGSFIDAVGDSTLSDSESKLQKWQELGLINSNDKAEESAASAAAAKSERVQALENRAKQLAMADKKYTAEAQNAALAEYKALAEAYKTNGEAAFEGKNYSQDVKDWAKMYAEVDNSTAYGWSKNELLYAIQDSVLNAAPGQVLTVDKANVQGKNISLSAGKNIGIDGEATNIAYSEMGKLDNLKLLAQAKAGDLTWNDADNRIEVRQQRQITVQLTDGGKLNLKANTSGADNTGNVYLAGVKDTMLDISGTINTTQDVKLLSDKGIRMNDGSIVADNLIIQGGKGNVGSKDAFIKTNISGNLEANTDTGYGVYLHQTAAGGKPAQVLTIQDAATGTLVLKADNGMQMTTEAGKNTGYLNANSINLQAANGDIGKADDGIRILENGAVINAKAENGSVYLQGAGTKDAGLVVDSITAKGNAKLNLDGDVNFGNDTGNGSISAGGDVTVNGNNVNLNAGTVTAGGASNITAGKDVNVTTGSITSSGAGNITAGNNVNLNSSTLAAGADSVITATNGNIALGSSGITVNGANNGLKLDANGSVMQDAAAAGITADNLTVESGKTQQLLSRNNKVKSLTIKGKNAGSSLMVDGVTRFNGTTDNLLVTVADSHIKGDVLIENYQADTGKITINSTIDTSKYNDEHTGNITVTTDGDITTADGVALNAADKVSINSRKGSVATGGNVTANNEVDIDAANNITANGSLTSTNANVDLNAGGSIMTNSTVNALNNVIANANGNINTNGDVTATNGKAVLNSSTGSVTTKNVTAGQAVDIDAEQDITADGNLTSNNADSTLDAGGKITINGNTKALKNVTANAKGDINTNGDVTATNGKAVLNSSAGSVTMKNVTAGQAVDIYAANSITANGNLTSTNANVDLLAGGSITTKGTVNALNNLIANANGNINTNGDVTATNGKAVLNSSTGSVNTQNVTAGQAVDIDAEQDITADGNLISNSGDITLDAGGSITTKGTVNALNNVIANANGNINTNGDVTATNGNAVLNSSTGSVNTQNVTAGQVVDIDAANNITADGYLNAKNGDITLDAGGSITTNSTVNANNNVIANANSDINTKGDVTATNGKAVLNSSAGSVTTKNITAGQAVDIDAAKDITASGNLTSTNANVDLNAGGSITTSGQVKAQQNVDYNAKGSITTGNSINSTAGNIHLQTDAAKGDITFGGDVTADHGNINIDVLQNGSVTDHDDKFKALGDKGDINSGNFALQIKGTGDVDLHEIYATNNALIDVANGNLTLAKIDGNLVALQLKTEGKQMKVDELIAGTKIIAQGSDIDLNKIQQRLDADGLLTIVPDGAQPDKPIDNLKIGEIITNKGVRFEHLWLNNGSIKVSEGMFHIDKLVVNNVAHFSNKHMKTAVWGAPPQRDGSDSVYWNNIAVNNPADNLTEWQQEGTNPDKWMYLHFTAQPNVQHSNGALLDLRNYDYVYDQRFTAVDHMLQQLNENKAEEYDINHAPDVVQYFRYDLYDLDEDDNKSEPVKITVEA